MSRRATRMLLVAAVMVGLGAVGTADSYPRCFGAASRDPVHRCHNPQLRVLVIPTPAVAQITPSAPCTPLPGAGPPDLCGSGVSSAEAIKTVALIGDSHAVHWRAALDVVAGARQWRVVTLFRTVCPFSLAVPRQRKSLRVGCVAWRRQVLRWMTSHPEVDTVVVSAHSGGGVRAKPGQDQFAAKVGGFAGAWGALPASVKHVIVLRDVPYNEDRTLSCVAKAMRRHEAAGWVCRLPRETALRPDPAVAAAAQLGPPRVLAIDLSRFMCSRHWCFPVVGGALVRKDHGHLTRVFSGTLGPYQLRRINRLVPGG